MKRIGLIGCGHWGKNILRDLLQLNSEVLVADHAAARQRATEQGATEVYPTLEQLPPCDGYVVAVPIPLLTPVSAKILKRKKPVFSEKTLLLSENDYLTLKNMGVGELLFTMHKWHYHPGIEALREVSQSGRLGAILQVNCVRHHWVQNFHGGDLLSNLGVHDLTIVEHILGYVPQDIVAVKVFSNKTGVLVGCKALLGDRPSVSLSINGAHCFKRSGVTVQGDLGMAGLRDALDDHILVRTASGDEKILIDTTYPLYLELKEFIEFLGGGAKPRCDLDNAWMISQTLLKLRESAGIN